MVLVEKDCTCQVKKCNSLSARIVQMVVRGKNFEYLAFYSLCRIHSIEIQTDPPKTVKGRLGTFKVEMEYIK